MCLDKVDKVTRKGKGIGYKVFFVRDGKLYHWFNPVRSDNPNPLPIEEWIDDPNDGTLTIGKGKEYRQGFHVFKELNNEIEKFKSDLRDEVYKVKYKDVVASGMNERIKCVVARKMYIMKGEL